MLYRVKVHTLIAKCVLPFAFATIPTCAIAEDTKSNPHTLPGKQVTLRYGPGFNVFIAKGIRDDLIKQGCPATLTEERGFPGHITVEVGDEVFRSTSSGSAGAAALDMCKPKPKGKHVTLRIGPGFDQLTAMGIRALLIKEGCPATLHSDGPFNDSIDVEIGEDWETFERAGSASSYALDVCRGKK